MSKNLWMDMAGVKSSFFCPADNAFYFIAKAYHRIGVL
jgi:hypothetical protein